MRKDTLIGIVVAVGFLGVGGYVGYQKWLNPTDSGSVQNLTNPGDIAAEPPPPDDHDELPSPSAPPSSAAMIASTNSGWAPVSITPTDPESPKESQPTEAVPAAPTASAGPPSPPSIVPTAGEIAPPTQPKMEPESVHSEPAPSMIPPVPPMLPPTAPATQPLERPPASETSSPRQSEPITGQTVGTGDINEQPKVVTKEEPSDERGEKTAPPVLPGTDVILPPTIPVMPPAPPAETNPQPLTPPKTIEDKATEDSKTSVVPPPVPPEIGLNPPTPPSVPSGERIEIPPPAGLRLREPAGSPTASTGELASPTMPPPADIPQPLGQMDRTASPIAGTPPIRIQEPAPAGRPDGILPIPIRDNSARADVGRQGGTIQVAAVESYDLVSVVPRPGETHVSLSKQLYGSERYADALRAYLEDYDPRLASLPPGRTLSLPPAEVLERRFGEFLPESAGKNTSSTTGSREKVSPAGTAASTAATGSSRSQTPATTNRDAESTLPAASDLRYQVKKNETLYAIAKRVLGNGERWGDIYNLNKDLLRGSVEVEAGMVLRLPPGARIDSQ